MLAIQRKLRHNEMGAQDTRRQEVDWDCTLIARLVSTKEEGSFSLESWDQGVGNMLEEMAAELDLKRRIHQAGKIGKAASTVSTQYMQKASGLKCLQ